jgi:hypothetical protein
MASLKFDEITDLHEALYRHGKGIKRNAHKLLAQARIAELQAIDTRSYDLEEKALIENEITDLQYFLGRTQWQ